MAIITYTSGTLTVGDETFDLAELGIRSISTDAAVVRDRSCVVCGAKWLTFADGSVQYEVCSNHAHACDRTVGRKRCLCGHLREDHMTTGENERVCLLCAELAEQCDRYRASERREPKE